MGPGFVLKMTESLQNSHCMFFYNFFSSPSPIAKLCEGGLYGIDTAWKDREGMLELPVDGNEENWYWVLVFRQGSLL